MSAPQPWECPRCHRMNAPFSEQCKCTAMNMGVNLTVTPSAETPEQVTRAIATTPRNGNGGPRPKPRPYKMKRHAYDVLVAIQKLLAEYGEPLTLAEIAGYLWKEWGYSSRSSGYSGMHQILTDHSDLIGAVRTSSDPVTFDLRYNQRKARLSAGDPRDRTDEE